MKTILSNEVNGSCEVTQNERIAATTITNETEKDEIELWCQMKQKQIFKQRTHSQILWRSSTRTHTDRHCIRIQLRVVVWPIRHDTIAVVAAAAAAAALHTSSIHPIISFSFICSYGVRVYPFIVTDSVEKKRFKRDSILCGKKHKIYRETNTYTHVRTYAHIDAQTRKTHELCSSVFWFCHVKDDNVQSWHDKCTFLLIPFHRRVRCLLLESEPITKR